LIIRIIIPVPCSCSLTCLVSM